MAAAWNRCTRRPSANLLGCLLALLLVKSWSSQSWGFAGPALQPRSAAHRGALPLQAKGQAAETSLDDLFSSDDVTPKQLSQTAQEATTSALDAFKGKSGVNSFDVSAFADSFGSATVTKLIKLFPTLEPQLSTQDPKQVALAVGVVAVVFLTLLKGLLLTGNENSTTDDSAINPKAAGSSASSSSSSSSSTNTSSVTPVVSNATIESRGTPVVSSQQPVLTVSETSDPESPSASAQVKTDVIELTDGNAIKSAAFIALLVGYACGGSWLAVTLFMAASWAGTRRTDEFATAVKGLGRNGVKVVNFGAYLEGKYKLTEQLGSSITNASSSVKEEYKQAGAVIDFAASVVGVVLDNEAAIQGSVDSITTAVTGAACLAGDAAVQVLNKTADALGELGESSGKDSGKDIGSSKGVKVPAPSQTEKELASA